MNWLSVSLIEGFGYGDAEFLDKPSFAFGCRKGVFGLDVSVSDYLDEAPDDVQCETLLGVGRRFTGKPDSGNYEKLKKYVSTDGFLESKRPVYLSRNKIISNSDIGQYRNLSESVERLYDSNLLRESDLDNTVIRWGTRTTYHCLGRCCPMFRTIFISPLLDTDELSDHAVDMVVYHEYMHNRIGFKPFSHVHHGPDFKREMSYYPDIEAANREVFGYARAYGKKHGRRVLNSIIGARNYATDGRIR